MTPSIHILGATVGVAITSGASLVAQVVDTSGGGNAVTITSAGATVAAVTALAYVARLMATGGLIAKSTNAAEEKMLALLEASSRREDVQIRIIEEAAKREDRFYDLVASGKITPKGNGS